MAKKPGRPRSGRNDATAKLDVVILGRAKYIAQYEGKTLVQYLNEVLAPIVERRMQEIAREMLDHPKS